MVSLLGGVFLGWSLGANDAANCFGSAVASRMVRFWTAAGLCAAFVVLGALLEGQAGIETLKDLTQIDLEQAVVITVAAAVTVTIMTWFGLPVSTSQAAVGAILGIGFFNQEINVAGLGKVVACWFGTPVGAVVISLLLYKLLAAIYNRLTVSIFRADSLLRIGLVVAGSYASYTLGANNVANATAVFVGAGMLTVFQAALIGGLSIAFGVLTYSRRVMETVGTKLVRLDPFSGRRPHRALLHAARSAGVDLPGRGGSGAGHRDSERGRHHQTQDALRHPGRLVPDAAGGLLHRHVHLLRHTPGVRCQINTDGF
jgi:PiT family inorganic phosphate transporter